MRIRLSLVQNSFVGASWLLLVACSGSTPNTGEQPSSASGGTNVLSGQGGNTNFGNGGATQVGGNSSTTSASTGGTTTSTGTGGVAPSNGGSVAAGGATVRGGATGAGASPPAGGATTSAGGVTTTVGGATTTVGGATNRGGATTTVGGATSSGGTTTRGGSTSTSTCVDTPRSSESCADAKAWGFCTQTWFANCQVTCGTCSTGTGSGGATSAGGSTSTTVGGSAAGGATTTTPTGGSTGTGVSVTPLTNGKPGKTTRYWDCCKPSCGWKANAQQGGKSSPASSCAKDGATAVGNDTQSVCSGGSAYQCNWGAPWQVGPNLAYGYAAFNGTNCGKCYQLDFSGTGDNPGAQSLKGKSMIVQAINIGDIGADHFDLLVPGGGVGANNGCYGSGSQYQWGNVNGGAQSGGFLTTCGNNMTCITGMCQSAFGSNSNLMAGCNWFVGWFAGANNPGMVYAEVPCPAELSNKSALK